MTEIERHSAPPHARDARRSRVPWAVGGGAALVAIAIVLLVWHAESKTNKVAMASAPKPVSVVLTKAAAFRPERTYIGTLAPWVAASVGPQFVSAYVDTVLVRPGAPVQKGQVVATLDCRNANAASRAVAMQARAIEAQQRAQANQAERYSGLLEGGFAAKNQVEQEQAKSSAESATLAATQAQLASTALSVSDCVLRAPFDGEVAMRLADPGAFVRPGSPVVSVIDRSTVRYTADVPESDFDAVAPGTPIRIRLLSTNKVLTATVSRRAPSADPATRTVHIEVDLPDPNRSIPVGTTGEARLLVGDPITATELPLAAAAVRNSKASVFVIDGDVAHARTFASIGESGGSLFVDPALPAGARVVIEGRGLLEDGDRVAARERPEPAPSSRAAPAPGPPAGGRP